MSKGKPRLRRNKPQQVTTSHYWRQPPTANAFDGLSARKTPHFAAIFPIKIQKMGVCAKNA
jgi:hypothetical protein